MSTTWHDERLFDGAHCPVGHVIAILSDGRQAGQAAWFLREAGFAEVVIFDGPLALQALRAMEGNEHKASPLARAWERLALRLSDDTGARREALEALRQGHACVAVHVSGGAQADQVEGILRAHGAYAPRYFGHWPIMDLTR